SYQRPGVTVTACSIHAVEAPSACSSSEPPGPASTHPREAFHPASPSSNDALRSTGPIGIAGGVGDAVRAGVALVLGVAVALGVAVGVGSGDGCTVGVTAGAAPTWVMVTPSMRNDAPGASTLASTTTRTCMLPAGATASKVSGRNPGASEEIAAGGTANSPALPPCASRN